MAEVEVNTQIVIKKPIGEVSGFAAHPDNVPRWYKNIYEVKWVTEPEIKVGSQIAFKARFLGKDMAYVYEIVAWEPEKRMVMRTADGPFPMETTYLWEATEPKATKMTLINRGKPSGFSKILTPFMKMAMKKANAKDLQLLKEVLEID